MSIFEIGMLICFGCAWPVSIWKSYHSKQNAGKSLNTINNFFKKIEKILFHTIALIKVKYNLYRAYIDNKQLIPYSHRDNRTNMTFYKWTISPA